MRLITYHAKSDNGIGVMLETIGQGRADRGIVRLRQHQGVAPRYQVQGQQGIETGRAIVVQALHRGQQSDAIRDLS